MIKTFIYNDKEYPEYEREGFAAQFAFPFALKVCHGKGLDIGYGKEEWKFPGAIGVEKGDALPCEEYDYIFSSHCLEHIPDWVGALDYWITRLKIEGVMFLYLPHYDQEYWRPWNNRKHIHIFTPQILRDFLADRRFIKIFNSERDLNDSFMIYGEKEGQKF